jgi:site-specific recombinase XerD
MNGSEIYTVQKLLGHSSIKTTEIYAHLAPDFLKAAVEKLEF